MTKGKSDASPPGPKAARKGVWEWDLGADEVVWSLGAPALYGVAQSVFRLSL